MLTGAHCGEERRNAEQNSHWAIHQIRTFTIGSDWPSRLYCRQCIHNSIAHSALPCRCCRNIMVLLWTHDAMFPWKISCKIGWERKCSKTRSLKSEIVLWKTFCLPKNHLDQFSTDFSVTFLWLRFLITSLNFRLKPRQLFRIYYLLNYCLWVIHETPRNH